MAKINKKGDFKGKVGNLVYREINGKAIVQSGPGRVKQTLASKLAAQEFAMASNAAAILRKIGIFLYEYSDGQVSGRLNAVLRHCLKEVDRAVGERTVADIDPSPLAGFQFNMDAPFERCLNKAMQVSVSKEGSITVSITKLSPNMDIPFLEIMAKTTLTVACSLRLAAISVNYRAGEWNMLQLDEMELATRTNWKLGPRDIHWTCLKRLEEKDFVLLYGSLHYYREDFLGQKKYVAERQYSPAAILTAFRVDEQIYMLNKALTAEDEQYLPFRAKEKFYDITDEKLRIMADIQAKEEKKKKRKKTR
ncbi:hypothetical protein [Olivibacter sitiensis]|uniref:hypothetical protein n=1 Tax=Olivibacter sitiensis TaxID=376470 RepID=UPI0003F7875D|nr:hypothetical protein [Olivibacter sitiensis]